MIMKLFPTPERIDSSPDIVWCDSSVHPEAEAPVVAHVDAGGGACYCQACWDVGEPLVTPSVVSARMARLTYDAQHIRTINEMVAAAQAALDVGESFGPGVCEKCSEIGEPYSERPGRTAWVWRCFTCEPDVGAEAYLWEASVRDSISDFAETATESSVGRSTAGIATKYRGPAIPEDKAIHLANPWLIVRAADRINRHSELVSQVLTGLGYYTKSELEETLRRRVQAMREDLDRLEAELF